MSALKCDKQMRRSKERAYIITPTGLRYRWTCTGKCDRCICGMRKQSDGTYEHVRISK